MRTAKIHRRFLLALSVLAISLAALVPATRAATGPFAFEAGAFAKAHSPLQQKPPTLCPPSFLPFQCLFSGAESGPQEWIDTIEAAPEPTQAGAHPDFTTHFRFAQSGIPGNEPYLAAGSPKTIITDAPAGAVGNPLSVQRCTQAEFQLTLNGNCPPASQVGVSLTAADGLGVFYSPAESLIPSPGEPGLLGFKSVVYTAILTPEVRSDGDYGLRITADGIPQTLFTYIGNTITLWGVPHDPVHDPYRFNEAGGLGTLPGEFDGDTLKPFLSAPTNCSSGPITLTQKATPWEHPGLWAETHSTAEEPTGCDQVPFDPGISARPTTNTADSPSGLEVDVSTPQHESCEVIPALEGKLEEFKETEGAIQDKRKEMQQLLEEGRYADYEAAAEELKETEKELRELGAESFYDCGLVTSHLKDTTVTLPAGMSINPSSANGLEGCSIAQIGLTTPIGVSPQQFTKAIPTCPESSRIGSVEVDTPLLDAPMPGSVFIAKPYENPFNSLLAIYIVANDEERGLIVKLAGKVEADPVTGQLRTTVTNAPQLPFSHFTLHFKQGPHATLRTPGACGTYTTDAALSPYSAPTTPVDRQGTFAIDQGPGGGCNTPNAPEIDAGSVSPIAGLATPTVVSLRRADGSQEFSKVNLTLPPGLTGKLAGVGQCPDAALATAAAKSGREEQANPSCSASSHIGKVYIAAGSGPAPYNTAADAYLTGPYKGAPLSMAVIAPAVAGPFDLGTVVVRVALAVNPQTAQIEASTDEFPRILAGIPLDVRSVRMVLDRPDFTRNGTSCDPSAFTGAMTSTLGQAAPLSERFQLAECSSLSFKPKLAIRLFGGTKRGDHPALRGVVQMPVDGANIAKASVALPHSEFLDQSHIGTVCTRVQFAQGDGNGSACPPASVYGKAIAESPLVDYALVGPAILRSSSHKLPDLVIALHGPPSQPVQADVVGRIDSVNGGIRTTFEGVPDIPVSKFVLSMKGGRKGLLQNSTDICEGTHKASAKFTGQNAKTAELAPELRNGKCGKAKKRGGKAKGPVAPRGSAR
jgi:hypothetical protein